MTHNLFNHSSIIGDFGCFLIFPPYVINSVAVTLCAYKSSTVSLILPGNGFLGEGLLN